MLISKSPACSKSSLMSIKPLMMRTMQTSGNSPFWASLISSSLGLAPSSSNRLRVSASPVFIARLSGLLSSWTMEVDMLIAVCCTWVLRGQDCQALMLCDTHKTGYLMGVNSLSFMVTTVLRQVTNNGNVVIHNLRSDSEAGWCGVHVTQHQKENPNDPSSHYRLDVTLYDGAQKEIGKVTNQDAPAGKGIGVTSALPFVLIVTAQNVDADAVLFKYSDQSWGSNDQEHHRSFGSYDSGSRYVLIPGSPIWL